MTCNHPQKTVIIAAAIMLVVYITTQLLLTYLSYVMVADTNTKTKEIHAIFYPDDGEVEVIIE